MSGSEYDGFLYLKVFLLNAAKREMIKKLKEYTGADGTVTFGSIKGKYDVYIDDVGGNETVKKLKKLWRSGSRFSEQGDDRMSKVREIML